MVESLGSLAARVAVGAGIAAHGSQKAFGWFEGPGPEGAGRFMESLGFKPACSTRASRRRMNSAPAC